MLVRSIFIRYRNAKYQIDGILYKSEMYIPEIVRDRTIRTYGKLGDTIFIKTRERYLLLSGNWYFLYRCKDG